MGYWPFHGDDEIAEWVIAAIFQLLYQLPRRSEDFKACAFADDAPTKCAAASTATNHTTFADLTIGVVGYGNIGHKVAQKASALSATVVATKVHGPFDPPPAGLKWLSPDNDRLYREADVVVVTVPGLGPNTVIGLINKTGIALMKDSAIFINVAAAPVNFGDLEAALKARPALRAVIDTWPSGCMHLFNTTCGPPYGEKDWPGTRTIANLPNVLPLPRMSMRDAAYWKYSVEQVGM